MNFADVQLGERYRDEFTGFEGHAIGRADYLNGLQSVLLVRGSATRLPEEQWIAVGRVKPVSADGDTWRGAL